MAAGGGSADVEAEGAAKMESISKSSVGFGLEEEEVEGTGCLGVFEGLVVGMGVDLDAFLAPAVGLVEEEVSFGICWSLKVNSSRREEELFELALSSSFPSLPTLTCSEERCLPLFQQQLSRRSSTLKARTQD